MMSNVNSIFKSLKRDKLIMDFFRYIIGTILVASGLLLTIFLDSYLYLIIGILLCMVDSVIVIGIIIFDNKKSIAIKKQTLKDTIPFMEFKASNEDITEIYNYFDYKNHLNHIDVCDSMVGNEIISFSVRAKMSNKKYYLRMYKINLKNNINIYNIKSDLLTNFRYEIIENTLYLSIISKKDITLNPMSYKTYDDYKGRYLKELGLLNSFIQMEEIK